MSVDIILGTHRESWLADPRFASTRLFVSRRRLVDRKRLPRALGRWDCDSGGFSELTLFGKWMTPPRVFANEVRRFMSEIGGMGWVAAQDWMCEPSILQKTGLDVQRHQTLTIDNYQELLNLAPDLPWVPVLQGWHEEDYFRHLDEYVRRGFDLRKNAVVGIGSVCRRQNTAMAEFVIQSMWSMGIKLHGFGFKEAGLCRVKNYLVSSDSMAWSFAARKRNVFPECKIGHMNCANCAAWALEWHRRIIEAVGASNGPRQPSLSIRYALGGA